MKKFWNWIKNQNLEETERVLEINGDIASESWFEDDVTPKMFKDELSSGKGPITVWINSPGGDCFAASSIYTMLIDYPYDVTIKVDSLAASAASVIAMAGKLIMSPTAMLMIHNPATTATGDHGDFEKVVKMLDEVKESIINAYEMKTGLSRNKISKMMEEETWLNAKKAKEYGFCDEIISDEKKTELIEPLEFSQRKVDAVLLKKITDKVKPELPEKQPESGRKAEDLLMELDVMNRFFNIGGNKHDN